MRYGVVIIGAGSAGNVIATRPSVVKERSELLEAGRITQTFIISSTICIVLTHSCNPSILANTTGLMASIMSSLRPRHIGTRDRYQPHFCHESGMHEDHLCPTAYN
jgi:choline dehydrogenase-like flavoprotein